MFSLIKNHDIIHFLYKFFRIISVGGDGMFSEVMNGVLKYQEHQHQILTSTKMKPVVLGIIPAGTYLYISL